MHFPSKVRVTSFDISLEEYFEGACPYCHSTHLTIRSSRLRTVPDLGTPLEKRIARIKMATFRCNDCGKKFSPKHPDYPQKFEYSLAIITYALDCYYKHNSSGTEIAQNLLTLHQVEVPVDTINSWIKLLSADYFKARKQKPPKADPQEIKTLSVDGTFVSTGKDIIGKKKPVDLLSVTKRKNGTYALTWSRMRL